MRDGGYVGIGWRGIGDLSDLKYDMDSRSKVKTLMEDKYNEKGGYAQEIFNFVTVVQTGVLILATEKEGSVLGIGKVKGGYSYKGGTFNPNRLKVEWYPEQKWQTPLTEIKNRVVKQIPTPENIMGVESRLLGLSLVPPPNGSSPQFSGMTARIQQVLERKKQIILFGPPGTSKTHYAFHSTYDIASQNLFGKAYNELEDLEKDVITGNDQNLGYVRFCTYQPSYGNEDFIEGYRSITTYGVLSYEPKQGIFKKLCHDAVQEPERKFYLIIDEINRGDIPRIFGELITLLERTNEDDQSSLRSPVSDSGFQKTFIRSEP